MTNSQQYSEVLNALEGYFDGLYHANTKQLAEVFHPDARYINMGVGDYMNKSLPEYFEIVERRTPPANKDEGREDRLLSIEFGGSQMAFVKASMTMMGREYLDFLTLTHDHFGWRIMTKVFTYIPKIQEA